ncbi:hypothetical protein [Polaribacter cellanae]|uniref:Uncharacterized protein n=1 Tax=Polaribacter cellanae TaxID=2818493 RepID=A0A975H8L6_9FLAO|nr:hypothetical protein [Polaribacter cellanae]QTE24253.1 hypothetical protein J3359_08330 [Polaribacter cellanae]
MTTPSEELKSLFSEAMARSEFDVVLTILNYRGISSANLNSNLMEWFDAIPFYYKLFNELEEKEKARMGLQLYSTFFENSDFYNILGSLCRIKLGYKGSSYLFWKTKKYERLLGIGEKQEFLLELLADAEKTILIDFYEKNHFKEIRNTFFHSAYSIEDGDYVMHDSEPMNIEGVLKKSFDIEEFFYPKLEEVFNLFQTFKDTYWEIFNSYQKDKMVDGSFPNPCEVTILGSSEGLKGFRIKNAVNFYGKWHDSGIWYDEKYKFWAGHNINMYFDRIEDIEIDEQLQRFENKDDITKNNADFFNLVDKVVERNNANEIVRATQLLLKFGDIRKTKMDTEENIYKKRSFPKMILPYYRKALEIGSAFFKDVEAFKKTIAGLEVEA